MNRFLLSVVILCLFTQLFGGSEVFRANISIGDRVQFTLKGKYTVKNGLVVNTTDYFDKNGRRIITEQIRYKDDSFDLVDLKIQDSETGRQEEIVKQNDTYLVRYRQNFKSKLDERIIKEDGTILHASNVALFIMKNIDYLKSNQVVAVKLLVPEHLRTIEFQVKLTGSKTINGHDCYEILMEPTRLVFKPLVNTINFYYDKAEPNKIYLYKGVVLPRDPEGNKLVGTIVFRYGESS